MSGETEKDVSGLTVDTLLLLMNERDRRYEQRFEAQKEAVDKALQSAKEAVVKAENATEKRFEAVNEFRATVTDISSNNVTRAEHDANKARNDERYQELADRLNRAEGSDAGSQLTRSQFYGALMLAVIALGVVVGFANYIAAH